VPPVPPAARLLTSTIYHGTPEIEILKSVMVFFPEKRRKQEETFNDK